MYSFACEQLHSLVLLDLDCLDMQGSFLTYNKFHKIRILKSSGNLWAAEAHVCYLTFTDTSIVFLKVIT